MLTMSQINHIKDLSNCGYRISEISKKTGADPKTIRKYLAQDDFSPQPPIILEKQSKLDPFKPIIQEWLDEDKKHWRKQHHTAQRVYERLVEEHGYTGSYSIVQRYMKKCRSIQTEKANLELIWDPGLLMLSWAVMISLCHADMRLPGYLSWNVSFDGADLSAPSRKELVHTSMLCQHFKRRYDGTGICLFHSAVMPEAFLIPEEICQ